VAAALTALACLLKLYPIAVGLLLVALYPRKFGGRLAVALAIGLVLPFGLQDPAYVAGQYQSWFRYLRADDRSGLPSELAYRDLQHLSRVCGILISTDTYRLAQVLAGAGMVALCLAARRGGWDRGRLLTYLLSLGCCWMTVFGPATESCTYLLVAPPLAAAMLEAPKQNHVLKRGLLAGSYALLVVAHAACWFPQGRSIQALGIQPLAALLLLGCLVPEPFQVRGAGEGSGLPAPAA
jgi:hypothetical protein